MDSNAKLQNRPWQRFLVAFAIWTALGLFQAVRLYLIYNQGSYEISWGLSIAWALADWYIWGLLSLGIFAVAGRISLESSRWYTVVGIHLPLAFLVGIVQLFFYAQATHVLDDWFYSRIGEGTQSVWTTWYYLSINRWHSVLITYFLIASAAYAWRFYQHKRAEELRRVEVESQLARAQLSSLKARLHPHFLFNTLNAITALIHTDPQTADRMISRLSDLLRMAIDTEEQPEVPLQQEIEFVERYLAIQQLRFPDRLTIRYEIEPDVRDAAVPNLILQPLVENAVQYAVAPYDRAGCIEIAAARRGSRLEMMVTDGGPGLPPDFTWKHGGLGLRSVRDRLARLYGPNATLECRGGEPEPFVISISMPFRVYTAAKESG